MAQVKGDGVVRLKVLAGKLKEADPKLRRELRRKMSAEAGPLVRKVQRSVLDMRSAHSGDHSFREQLAGTVHAQVRSTRAGVQVEIISSGDRMPPGMGKLPEYTDRARGWGHPVYDGPPRPRADWNWVRQVGKPGWFERPVAASHSDFKRAAQDAIDEVDRFLS